MKKEEKLKHARANLLLAFPFFGYLLCHLIDRITPDHTMTASTNGREIFWHPDFLQTLSWQDVRFVLVHETLHIALGHLFRCEQRNPDLWNIATDMCVNDLLLETGFSTKLPILTGANEESAEKVYDRIGVLSEKNGQTCVDDHRLWYKSHDQKTLKTRWQIALSQAFDFATSDNTKSFVNSSKIPKSLLRLIKQYKNPKRDWRHQLQDALHFPIDYCFPPSDRRFSRILLPVLDGKVRRLAIAVDTSASIDSKKLSDFFTEVLGIVCTYPFEGMVFICDSLVQEEIPLQKFSPTAVKGLKGGGGTDFRPVFDRLLQKASLGWKPDILLYLSDLFGIFPTKKPPFRVCWVVTTEDAENFIPFGERIVLV